MFVERCGNAFIQNKILSYAANIFSFMYKVKVHHILTICCTGLTITIIMLNGMILNSDILNFLYNIYTRNSQL